MKMAHIMAVSDREFGEFSQRVRNLEENVKDIKSTLGAVDSKVDAIKTTLSEVRGGWKVLIAIGGFAGVLGGIVTGIAIKIWPFLLGTLPKV